VLPAWDLLTGGYAAFALLAAIRRREATGLGGEVRLPLTDIAMGSSANLGRVAEVLYDARDRERLGNAVIGTIGRDFVTRDGVRLMIVAINERQWQGLVKALGLAVALAAVEAERGVLFTGSDSNRFRNRDAIFALIEREVARHDHSALAALLDTNGVVHGPYQTMVEALRDPRLLTENPMFAASTDNPSGFVYPAAGAFATLPALERKPAAAAPHLGQHSEAVLADVLGLSSGEIARLIDSGIVGANR
jgi:2-methylfumaryl-CoA isomerase